MHPTTPRHPAGQVEDGDQPGTHHLPGAVPAWRRKTDGEQRWPAALTVLAAIALQLVLPSRLGLRPKYLLPGLETALLIALVIANPGRFNARSRLLRAGGLIMIGLVIAANAASAGLLISDLLHSRGPTTNAGSLLTSAGDIYLTNIIAFGLLYWELDRRGPVARAHADVAHPDFMFPQMTNPDLARPHWEPQILDYLYLSLTNATAFSPTDTMPLTRPAKAFMGLQSAVALLTVGLAIARVTNILK
jgi:hypothetical protein